MSNKSGCGTPGHSPACGGNKSSGGSGKSSGDKSGGKSGGGGHQSSHTGGTGRSSIR